MDTGGDLIMICTGHLYEACSALFADYPLAADDLGDDLHSMVLMLRQCQDVGFYILMHESNEGRSSFWLRPWRTGGSVSIEANGADAISDVVVSAVTCGIPIPRHGSLFGWRAGDTVIALVAVYAEYAPAFAQPSWAVMPLVGIPEAQWPPFTGEPFFGKWFWEHYRAGSIVFLGDLIAQTPDTVFWVLDTEAIFGWGSCAVARDIKSGEGYTLRRGCYVYYRALRMGKPVPRLGALLASAGRTDLASRFRSYLPSGS